MAAVYKVGKKWRADWTEQGRFAHRQRFNTKREADASLTDDKSRSYQRRYLMLRRQKIPSFGDLAESWIAGRVEQSKDARRRL